MTSSLSDEDIADKLLKTIKLISEKTPEVPTFTDEQIEALKPIAVFMISMRNLFKFLKFLATFIKYIGVPIAIYLSWKNGTLNLSEWFRP